MDLLRLIVTLVVIGVLMWVINTYVPMAENIKRILNIVVVLVVCLWLLNLFVGFGGLRIPVGRQR